MNLKCQYCALYCCQCERILVLELYTPVAQKNPKGLKTLSGKGAYVNAAAFVYIQSDETVSEYSVSFAILLHTNELIV